MCFCPLGRYYCLPEDNEATIEEDEFVNDYDIGFWGDQRKKSMGEPVERPWPMVFGKRHSLEKKDEIG